MKNQGQLKATNSLQLILLTANGTNRMITKTSDFYYTDDFLYAGEIKDLAINLIKPTEEQNLTRLHLEFTPASPLLSKSKIKIRL